MIEAKFNLEDICDNQKKEKLISIVGRWAKYYSELYTNEITKGEPKAIIHLISGSKGTLENKTSRNKKFTLSGGESLSVNWFAFGLLDSPSKYMFLFRCALGVTVQGLFVEEWQKDVEYQFSFNLGISLDKTAPTKKINGATKLNFDFYDVEQPDNIRKAGFSTDDASLYGKGVSSAFQTIREARNRDVCQINLNKHSFPLCFTLNYLFPIIDNALLEHFKFEFGQDEGEQAVHGKNFGSW